MGEHDTFALTFLPPLGASRLLLVPLTPVPPLVPGGHDAPGELWVILRALVTRFAVATAAVIWSNERHSSNKQEHESSKSTVEEKLGRVFCASDSMIPGQNLY